MAAAESFEFNGKKYFAEELTVKQLDDLLAPPVPRSGKDGDLAPPSGDFTIFDLIFADEPVSSRAVELSTGIPASELAADVSPVELQTVLEVVKAANPFLLKAVKNGEKIFEKLKLIQGQHLEEQPAG